jgi:hypothetical protein
VSHEPYSQPRKVNPHYLITDNHGYTPPASLACRCKIIKPPPQHIAIRVELQPNGMILSICYSG